MGGVRKKKNAVRAKRLAEPTSGRQTDDDLDFHEAHHQKGLAALVREGVAETGTISRRDRFGRPKIRRVWRLTLVWCARAACPRGIRPSPAIPRRVRHSTSRRAGRADRTTRSRTGTPTRARPSPARLPEPTPAGGAVRRPPSSRPSRSSPAGTAEAATTAAAAAPRAQQATEPSAGPPQPPPRPHGPCDGPPLARARCSPPQNTHAHVERPRRTRLFSVTVQCDPVTLYAIIKCSNIIATGAQLHARTDEWRFRFRKCTEA